LTSYDPYATKKLVDLVGGSNVGVRYRPYLISEASAKAWLADQKKRARTQKEQEYWNR
jgi:hypothetical protein